jgi:uncharacterized protein YecE (DUF72 family)
MMTRWHIGAKQLRGAIASYAKRFDLLEVRVSLPPAALSAAPGRPGDKPRAQAKSERPEDASPNLGTLRRWRKAVPPHFHFAVVAGSHLSRARATEDAERELEAARLAIDALQARCFVLRTPPEVTPSSLWRERIAKIVARVPHDVTHFVWEPSGVWETADAAEQARSWGAFLAVDPLREPIPGGPVAYLRFRAIGETQSFGATALARAVNAVGARREVFAILESDSALPEAKRLRALLHGSPTEGGGGGAGRLVRPRRSIVVSDDEQE